MTTAIIGNCKTIDVSSLQRLIQIHAPETDTILVGSVNKLAKTAEDMATAYGYALEKELPDFENDGKLATRFRDSRIVRRSDFILSVGESFSTTIQHTLRIAKDRGKRYHAIQRYKNV